MQADGLQQRRRKLREFPGQRCRGGRAVQQMGHIQIACQLIGDAELDRAGADALVVVALIPIVQKPRQTGQTFILPVDPRHARRRLGDPQGMLEAATFHAMREVFASGLVKRIAENVCRTQLRCPALIRFDFAHFAHRFPVPLPTIEPMGGNIVEHPLHRQITYGQARLHAGAQVA